MKDLHFPIIRVVSLIVFLIFLAAESAETAKKPYFIYKDPTQPINRRINDLLRRMNLEEKIGQMTQIDRMVASPEIMRKYHIGSLLSGGGSYPAKEASPETWVDMVNDFQKGSLSTRLEIPMIYGIDAVHGHNTVYNATVFPHNIGLGATRDPAMVKKIGAATALEIRATGIQYTFAPCVAVCRDPRWGRCFESFSEDTQIVREMAAELIPGLQGDIPANSPNGFPFVAGKEKVLACAKHFVGDGGTIKGINENNTISSWNDLLKIHMPPYYDSIYNGVGTVMISYSSLNGEKMHANKDLITGFLKNTLNFQGFVISDSAGIDKITPEFHGNYTYSILAGVSAGIDMVMVPKLYKEFQNTLLYLVKRNFISMTRIDDAVRRILRIKFIMGLFENPFSDYSMTKFLGHKEHRELAREAVRKSLVLLKNDQYLNNNPMLPLPKKATRVLVAGTHANDIGNQCGGWTIEWHGLSGNITVGTTILESIKNTVDPETEIVFEENPELSYLKSSGDEFSYAIVVVGELPYSESSGDSRDLNIPEPGPSIIANVCGNIKCVVILITGRPVVIQPYLGQIDALVAAWLPGTEGQGVADVLFGDYSFTGKLPYTWFKTVDQLPMNFGDPHYDPLFPFGYGLTTEPQQLKAYY